MSERPTEALRKRLKEECLLTQLAWMCDDIDGQINALDATLAAKDRRIEELERRICKVHIQTSLAYRCDRTPNNEEVCRILESVEAAMDGIDILSVTDRKESPHA